MYFENFDENTETNFTLKILEKAFPSPGLVFISQFPPFRLW